MSVSPKELLTNYVPFAPTHRSIDGADGQLLSVASPVITYAGVSLPSAQGWLLTYNQVSMHRLGTYR